MITLTEKAIDKVRQILKHDGRKDGALRVGVKGGGCSGFTYVLDIDNKISDTDQVFEIEGVKIFIDAKSFVHLAGTELDYKESLTGSGFTFTNPNAVRSCGCGSSFQA